MPVACVVVYAVSEEFRNVRNSDSGMISYQLPCTIWALFGIGFRESPDFRNEQEFSYFSSAKPSGTKNGNNILALRYRFNDIFMRRRWRQAPMLYTSVVSLELEYNIGGREAKFHVDL